MNISKIIFQVFPILYSLTVLNTGLTASSNFTNFECPKNYFMVANMTHCRPLLTCADLKNVQLLKLIGYGAVKWVFVGKWADILIAVSVLRNPLFLNDFHDGMDILRSLKPNRYVVQFVGYCKDSNIIATEYHHLNNANSLRYLLLQRAPSFDFTMNLCLNFVEILNFLHRSPIGVRVNCDSDSVEKILSQIVVTHQFELVLCDVDALPEFTGNMSISCGKNIRQNPTSLVPPELTDGYNFGYSPKSDVWKIPNVCNYFFSLANADALSFSMFDITRKCKDDDPYKRPSAGETVIMYRQKFELLINKSYNVSMS